MNVDANSASEGQKRSISMIVIPVLTAFITMIGTVAVAYLNVLPQLRVVEPKTPIADAKGGTLAKQGSDPQAPHIQWRLTSLEPSISQEEFVRKAKNALNSSGFTGIEARENFVFGYSGQYTGVVLSSPPESLFFMVSGPEWEDADKKVVNLRRGF